MRHGGATARAADGVASAAAAAWAFRWWVELEAEARFERLSGRLERSGAPAQLVALASQASRDEARHAERCASIAAGLGRAVGGAVEEPPEVAPASLPAEAALTYELVAACCVAETLSVAVLTTLLEAVRVPGLRSVLRELAADEVGHARLGWARLASLPAGESAGFLGPLLPAMLRGSFDEDLLQPGAPVLEDPALLQLGVLPQAGRRDLFRRTLEAVVFPGLEGAGVDTAAGRAWLAWVVDGPPA